MSKIFGKGSKRSAVEDSTSNGEGSSDATTAHPEVDTSVSTTSNTPGTYIALNGLTVLTGEEEKSVDVVIVHGLNGSPDTTWTHANGFYWPKVLGQKVSNARVMVYGYNVKIEPTIGTNNIRIKSVADDLLNEVKQQRRKDPARRRPLVFIGHSLGGLVIKRALDRASRKTDDPLHFIYTSTKLALFFGTPNAGSQLTAMWRIRFLERLGKAAATEVPPNIKAALEMHSIELLDLADDFLDIDSIRRRELKIFSFFEELNYPGLGERVVDETSARLHVPDETYLGINANHVTMVKFENENNKTFKTVCGEVEDVADAADAGKPELQRSSSIPLEALQGAFEIVGRHMQNRTGLFISPLPAPGQASKSPPSFLDIPNERRVRYFSGRETVLTKLIEAFNDNTVSKCLSSIGLVGMGGIGKTQIALEFCQRLFNDHICRQVFWINAHSSQAINSSLTRIATALLGDHSNAPVGKVKDMVFDFLAASKQPYLLIYDNYDNPEFDSLLEFVPPTGTGLLLITSRLTDISGIVDQICNVDVMDTDEAAELLGRRSQAKVFTPDGKLFPSVQGILDLICGLPLAIDQAGAYVAKAKISFDLYLEYYKTRRRDLFKQIPSFWQYKNMDDNLKQKESLSVLTTWELSLRLLSGDEIVKHRKTMFLTQAAFLGSTTVSKVFFSCLSSILSLELEYPDRYQGALCDGPRCKGRDVRIQEIRYRCAMCYDVDFCATCEAIIALDGSHPHTLIEYHDDSGSGGIWRYSRIKPWPGIGVKRQNEMSVSVMSADEERVKHASLSNIKSAIEDFDDDTRILINEACRRIQEWMPVFCLSSTDLFDDLRYREIISEFSSLSLIQGYSISSLGLPSFSFHGLVQDWIRMRSSDQILYQAGTWFILSTVLYQFKQGDSPYLPLDYVSMASEGRPIAEEGVVTAAAAIAEELRQHIVYCVKQQEHSNTQHRNLTKLGADPWPSFAFAICLMNKGDMELPLEILQRLASSPMRNEFLDTSFIFQSLILRLEAHKSMKSIPSKDFELLISKNRELTGDRSVQIILLAQLLRISKEQDNRRQIMNVCREIYDLIEQTSDHFSTGFSDVLLAPAADSLVIFSTFEPPNLNMDAAVRSVKMTLDSIGPENVEPEVRHRCQTLLICNLLDQKKISEAEELARGYVNTAAQRMGNAHPDTIFAKYNLGLCFICQGRIAEAIAEQDPAFQYFVKVMSFDHPDCLDVVTLHLNMMMDLSPETESEARKFLSDKVEDAKRLYSRNPQKSMRTTLLVVKIYSRIGNHEDAYAVASELADAAADHLKYRDELRAHIEQAMLRPALDMQDELPRVEKVRVVDTLLKRLAHEKTLPASEATWKCSVSVGLCKLLADLGRSDEALEQFLYATELPEVEVEDVLECKRVLLQHCENNGRFEDARKIQERMIDMLIDQYGEGDTRTILAKKELEAWYLQQDEDD